MVVFFCVNCTSYLHTVELRFTIFNYVLLPYYFIDNHIAQSQSYFTVHIIRTSFKLFGSNGLEYVI